MLFELLGDEVPEADVHLLLLRVARDSDHLHPVEQRRRDRGHVVSGGDEQHLGQVKWNVQITGTS